MKYNHNKDQLENAVRGSFSLRETLKKLNIPWSGGMQGHIKRKLIKLKIDFSHFKGQGWSRGKISSQRLKPEDILICRPLIEGRAKSFQLKRALMELGVEYKCFKCSISDWNGQKLVLEIDHINNVNSDDRKENLQFLCPNCHSQKVSATLTDATCR